MHMVPLQGQGSAALGKYFLEQILARHNNNETSETHSRVLKHPNPDMFLRLKI